MIQMAIAAIAGFVLGALLKATVFSRNGGTNSGIALVIAVASWMVSVVGLSIFAEVQLGATRQPVWVGITALFFAGGIYYGVQRHAQK